MAETEVKEQEKQEEQPKPEKEERISLEAEIIKGYEADKKPEKVEKTEEKAEEFKTDDPNKKGPVKLSANERVQQAVNQKREAEERAQKAEKATENMQSEIASLKDELQKISSQLASGQMTHKQAEKATESASDDFEKAISGLDIPEELLSYTKNIADIANAMIKPLKVKLETLETERAEEKKVQADRDKEQNEKKAIGQYNEIGKEYSELWEVGEDGELTKDEKGFYVLKADFEKKAQKFVEPFYSPDGHNPMLMTHQGLKMLFDNLYQDIKTAKKVKEEIATTQKKVDESKKSHIESPESRNVPAKRQTIEEMFVDEYAKNR